MPSAIADSRPIRWGILGAGGIADTVSTDINLTEGNVVTAVAAPNEAAIYGTGGWISVLPEAYRPSGLIVHTGTDEYRIEDPLVGQGTGYRPEIEEVERCLRAGLSESPLIPHADTIAILEILDGARAALGVTYPTENIDHRGTTQQ